MAKIKGDKLLFSVSEEIEKLPRLFGELAYSDFEEVKRLGSFAKVLTNVERSLYQARLGEIVYDSDEEKLYFYSASGWEIIG